MPSENQAGMARALLTDGERRHISGQSDKEQRKYEAVSRVRARIDEELTTDVELLEEHHPELLNELRDVVCTGWLPRAFEIADGVLEVREQTRAGGEILPEDALDVVESQLETPGLSPSSVEEHPPELDEVETVMQAMSAAGLLNKTPSVMSEIFKAPGVEPSECEWCGAPFPEAGRHDVTVYNPEGEKMETESICSSCISDRY
jgi:hypothetical protein